MDRRTFAASAAALLAVGSVRVSAAQATPDEERGIPDFAVLPNIDRVTTRYAELASAGFDVLVSGDLIYVDAWGLVFTDVAAAQHGPGEMATAYRRWMTEEIGGRVSDLAQASARQLGDESWGWVAEFLNTDSETEIAWALYAVRKSETVQVLVGGSVGGSSLRQLADISERFIDRWPNEDPKTGSSNEQRGQFWDMLPRLSDLPEGMVIDYSSDATSLFT